jgi:hypothetical protein
MAGALREYATAARDCGMERPLVRELGWMADIVSDRETLVEIGEWLLDTGAEHEADRVFGRAFWDSQRTTTSESPWAYIVDYAKRDAWLSEDGRRVGEEDAFPVDQPVFLPLDYTAG